MKCSVWILAVIVSTTSIGFAAVTDTPRDQMKAGQENVQLAKMQTGQSQAKPLSAEGQAEVKRKEFVDLMTVLKDRESELDRQTITLRQEASNLQSRMEQVKLELKRVRVDQKEVQRNIRELDRERKIFDKKDKQRKIIEKMQSGN